MRRSPTQAALADEMRAHGIRDERLLAAFRAVPRHDFVPPELAERAYFDQPLAILHGQVTTQPSLSARMIEGLALTGAEKVLEIGAGYGFQTALLAELAAFVWSIERWSDIAAIASLNLERHGVVNAEVRVGDGSTGLSEHAPFDAILVSAAFPAVPDPFPEQLAEDGRLVQPIGSGGNEDVVLFLKREGRLVPQRSLTAAHFVRLYGQHGFRG